jgi:hypothetical protein
MEISWFLGEIFPCMRENLALFSVVLYLFDQIVIIDFYLSFNYHGCVGSHKES